MPRFLKRFAYLINTASPAVCLFLFACASIGFTPIESRAQDASTVPERIIERIGQLQNEMRQEQEAAQSDDATARQFWQQQAAMSGIQNSVGSAAGKLASTFAQSCMNSAASHRMRAQQLQNEIYGLNQQLRTVNSGILFQPTTPFGSQVVQQGGPVVLSGGWTQTFLGGTLSVSPNRVRYENRDKHGNLMKDSFDVSCLEIKEWKANKINFMNAFAGSYPQAWGFHIRLQTGRNTDFMASTDVELNTVLQAISRACGAS
jgi:hypothetical protein